ncbi:MAG: B12-binding domain-containing radical SAM protein [Thermoguttaceae bacterium]
MNPDGRPILLVQLPIPPPGPEPIRGNVPLAAASLKLFARRQGLEARFPIELLPPALCNTLGDQGLVEEILGRQPWMVGFTCYLWNIQRTLWVVEQLKRRQPQLKVLLGGPEITPDNAWALDPATIDYAVFGEGEQTFAELLAALGDPTEPAAIAGLWTARGGPAAARRNPLAALDAISSPYLEGILDAGAEPVMPLETVRGCRFQCRYCAYPQGRGPLRFLSTEQIAANLRHAIARQVPEVFLLDPTLNQRADFLDFLRGLARANAGGPLAFSGELRGEGIDAAAARLLGEANFKEVEIGLQSLEPSAQRLAGRRTNLAALETGIRAMLDEGIEVHLDLILGLPGETADSFRRGLDYLVRARPFSHLQIFPLSVLPGTALRRHAAGLGLEFQPRPPYYVLRTPTLGVDEMRLLMAEAQEAVGVEYDALPPPESLAKPQACGGPSGKNMIEGASACLVDLDLDEAPLPPAEQRAQAFTLWLRADDFQRRRQEAVALVRQVLADNPHTTLQVVLEPAADLRRLGAAVLESLLEACHASNSYLDWYYSLHLAGPAGAKRLVVVAPECRRGEVDGAWIEAVGDCATLVWR